MKQEDATNFDVIGETSSVVVFQNWMGRDEGLDDDVIDVCLQFVHVDALLLHLSVQGAQAPLTPVLFVPYELFATLVYCVIRQVHIQLVL